MSTNTQRSRASAFGVIKEESGSFPIEREIERLESDAVIAELAPDLVSLIPELPPEARSARPRPPTPSERAELVIEDLSLQLDNPYLKSSLVPPPKRPFPMARAVIIASGMLAAAAIGAVIQLNVLRTTHEPATNAGTAGIAAPVPAAAVAAAAPQRRAPEAVIAAPPAPEAAVTAPIAAQPAPVTAQPAAVIAQPVVAAPAAPVVAAVVPKAERIAPVQAAAVQPAPHVARTTPPAPPEPAVPVAEAATPAAVAPAADLPEYPTREQVTAGFEGVRSALAQCAAGRAGTVEIKASIASNGRIAHALVGGDFSGTPEGSCMARAVREAQFPAFTQPRLKVSYPFAL